MFNLIISFIAIGLVVLLAFSSIAYGGEAFKNDNKSKRVNIFKLLLRFKSMKLKRIKQGLINKYSPRTN